ncbi:MAG: VIT family protein [Acidimicrobiia bacterium]|nr:VIT family protein [Acidimicrobiia bacterium]
MARHRERHLSHRTGWLRAAVLGANDGIISVAALVLGVAAADTGRAAVLTAGIAGLSAGALSMGLGEYVSVSSQRDTEEADIAKERWELENVPDRELAELTAIYMEKGLDHDLASKVAAALTERDALRIHLIEELGITEATMARPWQAVFASMGAFAAGALLPLVAVAAVPDSGSSATRIGVTLVVAVLALLLLGWSGARLGGARPLRPVLRVVGGGVAAMTITMIIGALFGTAIG